MRRNLICLVLAVLLMLPVRAQEVESVSRGWFMKRLWEWAGSVPFAISETFSDVGPNSEWMEPIAWAESLGLVQGDGQGHFYPEAPLTYEQMELILKRYDTLLDRPGGTYCPGEKNDNLVTAGAAEKAIEKFYRDGAYAPSLLR